MPFRSPDRPFLRSHLHAYFLSPLVLFVSLVFSLLCLPCIRVSSVFDPWLLPSAFFVAFVCFVVLSLVGCGPRPRAVASADRLPPRPPRLYVSPASQSHAHFSPQTANPPAPKPIGYLTPAERPESCSFFEK